MSGAVSVSRPKNPVRVAIGRAAMRARWGPVRHVNLAELDADTARLIRALIANTDTEKVPAAASASTQEVDSVPGTVTTARSE